MVPEVEAGLRGDVQETDAQQEKNAEHDSLYGSPG